MRLPQPPRMARLCGAVGAAACLTAGALAHAGPLTDDAARQTAWSPAHPAASAPRRAAAVAAPLKLVDINSASRRELKRLPGVGETEAARIVAGRPYLSKAELVTKQVLPAGPYLALKNRVVALQTGVSTHRQK